jgi:hypothetical protein
LPSRTSVHSASFKPTHFREPASQPRRLAAHDGVRQAPRKPRQSRPSKAMINESNELVSSMFASGDAPDAMHGMVSQPITIAIKC